jgi:electron transport complex protein RnfA
MVQNYILLFIGAALVNNIVLVKILGLCPFMGVSKKLEASVAMAMATAFFYNEDPSVATRIRSYMMGSFLN